MQLVSVKLDLRAWNYKLFTREMKLNTGKTTINFTHVCYKMVKNKIYKVYVS